MPKKMDKEERDITIAILKETVAVVALHALISNSANEGTTKEDTIYAREIANHFVATSPLINLL